MPRTGTTPPRSLTTRKLRALLHAFRQGLDVNTAAAIAGLDRRTVGEWFTLGQQHRSAGDIHTPYARIAMLMDRAQGAAMGALQRSTVATGARDGKHALNVLARHPRTRADWGESPPPAPAGEGLAMLFSLIRGELPAAPSSPALADAEPGVYRELAPPGVTAEPDPRD